MQLHKFYLPKKASLIKNNIFSKSFNNFYKKRSIYTNLKKKDENSEKNLNAEKNQNNETNSTSVFQQDSSNIFTTQINNTNSNNLVYFFHEESEIAKTDHSKFFVNLPDDKFKFRISGEENQVITIDLHPSHEILCTRTEFLYHTQGVEYERVQVNSSLWGIFNRSVSGATILMYRYYFPYNRGFGRLCFSEKFPSKYIAIRLIDYGGSLICAKGSFLLGSSDIEIEAVTTSFFKAVLGGTTFFMQKLKSSDTNSLAILKVGGTIIRKQLRINETIIVRPHQLVFYQETVNFEVRVNKTFNTLLVAGLTTLYLTGPGEIVLQSMDFEDLIQEVVSRVNYSKSTSSSVTNKYGNENTHSADNSNQDSNENTNSTNDESESK
jgi:uncharacterized protein (AIM24 family)